MKRDYRTRFPMSMSIRFFSAVGAISGASLLENATNIAHYTLADVFAFQNGGQLMSFRAWFWPREEAPVEVAPKTIKEGVTKAQVEQVKKIEAFGAKVEIK